MKNISDIFFNRVEKNPEKTAIIDGHCILTYRELDYLSEQLAFYFFSVGIKKGDVVGVCLIKAYKPIATMLALLKLGAIYLPISTEVTQSRFQYVIDNSGCKFFILDSETFPKYHLIHCEMINVDHAINEIEKFSNLSNALVNKASNEIAYVIYTSGTTGKPKGVLASQKAVVNLVCNPGYVNITEHDVFLQLSPIEFDGSTFEIWGALLNGATLVLMPSGWPQLEVIAEKIKQYDVSIMFITTKLFNSLVDFKLDALSTVKQLYFGGEQASIEHVKKFMEKNDYSQLHNIYGPTECTTFSTCYKITKDIPNGKNIPIGKAINFGVETLVLSDDLSIVSEGEVGELYIGGIGVSPGYLNDFSLTEQKFIELPLFSSKGKFFKSGDLVRVLDDGNLEFLGRNDRLIKVRGFRVYLEEIENVIKEFPLIEHVAVIYVEENKEKTLIAYLVPKANQLIDLAAFKTFFLKKNPQFMLPTKIFILEDIPMTSSGKVDYKKLSDLAEKHHKKLTTKNLESFSELEAEIHRIWCKELNLEQIEITDDFFDLGGHSLKVINIIEVFKHSQHKILHKVSIIDLFKYSTIKDLVNRLEEIDAIST